MRMCSIDVILKTFNIDTALRMKFIADYFRKYEQICNYLFKVFEFCFQS